MTAGLPSMQPGTARAHAAKAAPSCSASSAFMAGLGYILPRTTIDVEFCRAADAAGAPHLGSASRNPVLKVAAPIGRAPVAD